VCINQNTYTGDGEVRLELLPRANIYFYGYFKGVSPEDSLSAALGESFGRSGVSSFSINSRQIDGFLLNSGGNIDAQEFDLKWCPKSESINGIGDESTQISFLIFHLFNFIDLLGPRHSIEQVDSTMYRIDH